MATSARAQAVPAVAEDHAVVFELGWAAQWSIEEGAQMKGATFALEVTPNERWLEFEFGFSAIRHNGSTEIPVDVLFKKPWTVSPQFEVMVGIGLELIHATGPYSGTYWGLSSVLDLLFWPRKNMAGTRNLGTR